MLPLQPVGFSCVWDGLLQFFTLLEAEASGHFVEYEPTYTSGIR